MLPPHARETVDPVGLSAAPRATRNYPATETVSARAHRPRSDEAEPLGLHPVRFWAAPGAFDGEEVDLHVEPFGDEHRFRASLAIYEYALGRRQFSERPRLSERSSVPTLILYGPEDHVIPPTFARQMEVAFTERVGPFELKEAGHFLQWEQPEQLNQAVRYVCLDLVRRGSKLT